MRQRCPSGASGSHSAGRREFSLARPGAPVYYSAGFRSNTGVFRVCHGCFPRTAECRPPADADLSQDNDGLLHVLLRMNVGQAPPRVFLGRCRFCTARARRPGRAYSRRRYQPDLQSTCEPVGPDQPRRGRLLAAVLGAAAPIVMRSDWATGANTNITQPVQFSTRTTWAASVSTAATATRRWRPPPCQHPAHQDLHELPLADLGTSPYLEPVRSSFRTGESLQWIRVHDLPDFVHFNHSSTSRRASAARPATGASTRWRGSGRRAPSRWSGASTATGAREVRAPAGRGLRDGLQARGQSGGDRPQAGQGIRDPETDHLLHLPPVTLDAGGWYSVHL